MLSAASSETGSQRPLSHLGWSLGTTCPFACAHCYTRKARDAGTHMTRPQAQDVAKWIRESGVNGIVLGGNEPIYAGSATYETACCR